MSKFKGLLGGLAACAALVFSAQAASAQQGRAWNGFYVGTQIGYGWVRNSSPSVDGMIGGFHAGYNIAVSSSALVGIEGDYNFSGLTESATIGGVGVKADVGALWSIRARLGFLPVENTLIYGTIGYGGYDLSASGILNGVTTGVSGNVSGLVAGGGLEYMFTRNITGRAETLWYMGNGGDSLSGVDADVASLRFGLSYKF